MKLLSTLLVIQETYALGFPSEEMCAAANDIKNCVTDGNCNNLGSCKETTTKDSFVFNNLKDNVGPIDLINTHVY